MTRRNLIMENKNLIKEEISVTTNEIPRLMTKLNPPREEGFFDNQRKNKLYDKKKIHCINCENFEHYVVEC